MPAKGSGAISASTRGSKKKGMEKRARPLPSTRWGVALIRPPVQRSKLLAEIDRQGALGGRHVDPFAASPARLQTLDAVLRQERDEAAVDMGAADDMAPLALMDDPELPSGAPAKEESGRGG